MSWNQRYPIAVDFSDGAAPTAVQFTTAHGVPAVRAGVRHEAATPSASNVSEDDQVAFVRSVVRNPLFKGRSIALLPPQQTILTYPLYVTLTKEEPLEAAIVREARDALDMPIEEAVLDYISVLPDPSEPDRARQILLVVMRRTDVQKQEEIISRAGGVLESMEPAVAALLRVHAACETPGAQRALLCNITRSHTILAVASRDGLGATRTVSWSTEALRRRLADNLELQNEKRDLPFLLRRYGLLDTAPGQDGPGNATPGNGVAPSATVAQLLAPTTDRLAHELHSIMGYVRAVTPDVTFGGVFLYGEGAQVAGMDRYLEHELNLPVKAVNPLERIALAEAQAVPEPTDGGRLALALGLGLRRVRWL